MTVTSEDIEKSVPKPTRSVTVTRFVPPGAIDPRLYDRPYFLGPAADSAADYFALAQALDRKKRAGIATWVMRKHSYVGRLVPRQGYLMLITLRHTEEVVPPGQLDAPEGAAFDAKERDPGRETDRGALRPTSTRTRITMNISNESTT